jgi:hypothetical protein
MTITFESRAREMGLQIVDRDRGMFEYRDSLSWVMYRTLFTDTASEHSEGEQPQRHETDGYEIPHVALFTKLPVGGPNNIYRYAGIVSRIYKFVGNDFLNDYIRQEIRKIGMPILRERTELNATLTRMRHEIVISNTVHTRVTDVLPLISIGNSYDGTLAQILQFGIEMPVNGNSYRFAFELGKVRQIHVAGASTVVSSIVENYQQVFAESMTEILDASFNTTISENDLYLILDVIEKIGKKRRDQISAFLQEMKPKEQRLPTAWQVFIAIVRYSSFEPNLNAKALLENAAESVLVVPPRIARVMRELSREEA